MSEPYPRSGLDGFRSWGDWRDIENNVYTIRENLAPGRTIHFHCYNKSEADETRAKLTEEERKQVVFFWLQFIREDKEESIHDHD